MNFISAENSNTDLKEAIAFASEITHYLHLLCILQILLSKVT